MLPTDRPTVRTGQRIDVERVSPFVGFTGKLVEALRIGGLGRRHGAHVEVADLVSHHRRDRFRLQHAHALMGAAVQQHPQEGHVVAWRAEGAAAAHEELRPLWNLEGRGRQSAVRVPVVEGGDPGFLLAADQEA